MNYNINVEGATISALAGGTFFSGLVILKACYAHVMYETKINLEELKQVSYLSFIGGSLTVFGIYSIVPDKIRLLWSSQK
jgi:hypothetical protein